MRRTAAALAFCGLLTLSACTIPGFGPAAASTTSTTSSTAKGPWTTVQRSDPPKPSPAPVPYVSPSPAILFLSSSPYPTRNPAASPSTAKVLCAGNHPPGATLTPDVSVSGGTATLTWWHDGDTTVSEYRVAPILEATTVGDQKNPVWTSVKPGKGCHQLTTTISGLVSGSTYEVWMDTLTTSASNPGRKVDRMVGRTPAFTIP